MDTGFGCAGYRRVEITVQCEEHTHLHLTPGSTKSSHLTPLVPQSRFVLKSLGIRLVCLQIGTAVLKGVTLVQLQNLRFGYKNHLELEWEFYWQPPNSSSSHTGSGPSIIVKVE